MDVADVGGNVSTAMALCVIVLNVVVSLVVWDKLCSHAFTPGCMPASMVLCPGTRIQRHIPICTKHVHTYEDIDAHVEARRVLPIGAVVVNIFVDIANQEDGAVMFEDVIVSMFHDTRLFLLKVVIVEMFEDVCLT